MTAVGHDLRPVLHCISQSRDVRDAFQQICHTAVQQGRFSAARIGRYDPSRCHLTWIAEETAAGRRSTDHEAARIPILNHGAAWGVLSVMLPAHEESSADDMKYLEDTCFVIGLAIDSGRFWDDGDSIPHEGLISQAANALAEQHALHARSGPEQSKAEFLAAVAHELCSPLTPVIGFTGMMLQNIPGPLNPEQQRQLEMIRTSSRRLLDLIKDILDLAKLSIGQTAVQPRRFDLNETVRKVAIPAEPIATVKGLILRCELPHLPTPMVSDPRLIEQLVTEILDNAIKFTDHGEVRLSVYTLPDARAGKHDGSDTPEYACIRITDTGTGIAPYAMPRIFTAFGHAGHGKSHPNEGSRLGLALCKGLVELLRGRIHADSRLDGGSSFTIQLPLHWHTT